MSTRDVRSWPSRSLLENWGKKKREAVCEQTVCCGFPKRRGGKKSSWLIICRKLMGQCKCDSDEIHVICCLPTSNLWSPPRSADRRHQRETSCPDRLFHIFLVWNKIWNAWLKGRKKHVAAHSCGAELHFWLRPRQQASQTHTNTPENEKNKAFKPPSRVHDVNAKWVTCVFEMW